MPSREAMYDEIQTLRAKLKEAEERAERYAKAWRKSRGETLQQTRAFERFKNAEEEFEHLGDVARAAEAALEDSATEGSHGLSEGHGLSGFECRPPGQAAAPLAESVQQALSEHGTYRDLVERLEAALEDSATEAGRRAVREHADSLRKLAEDSATEGPRTEEGKAILSDLIENSSAAEQADSATEEEKG